MSGLWMALRSRAGNIRKSIVERPNGIHHLGSRSTFKRPWNIEGRSGVSIGTDCTIMSDCSIKAVYDCGGKLASPLVWIEDNVYIGHHTTIVAMEGVHLASGCVLSDYVYLNDSNHGIDPERGLIMQQPVFSKGRIDIGQNCFLGYRAIVLSGVTLGEWCIVGANSVVTNSFPAYSMIAGTPARLIRRYSHGQKAWLKVPARNED